MTASTTVGHSQPRAFRDAVAALRSMPPPNHIIVDEIAAPKNIAPYSFAMTATVEHAASLETQGRLILLHDPAGQDAWGGTLRLVTFLSVDMDEEMATDPFMASVAWSWLSESLRDCDADYVAAGGTVTCTTSTKFGELRRDNEHASEASLELRASWTPIDDALGPHLRAWCALLASAAGLPPDTQS